MSITPRGLSIQEAYTWYRKGKLLVNRRYQRKLVWTVSEKQKLIDSILLGYPLPLILLAENKDSCYEIIDGMQRLNAIFTFIETSYSREDNKYFDINQFLTAKMEGDKGSFKLKRISDSNKISREDCAKIMDYQMAITIFSAKDETKTNEVFSRINSSGRQLSNQEKRQAGVVSEFSDLVRDISSEIRGDVSHKILELFKMPVISIDTKKESHGYEISAESTLWCHHGILSTKQLRQSEDEDMIADIVASILFIPSGFAKSKEKLDALYSEEANNINSKLIRYGKERLKKEIKTIFSIIDNTVKKFNTNPNILRKQVMGRGSSAASIKTPFYALFMAFYHLIIRENKIPDNEKEILRALSKVNKRLEKTTHHATIEQRKKNIHTVKGLIQNYFVEREPRQILHGPSLEIDLENSLRRSKIETPHYEFKQGFLRLDSSRSFDDNLIQKLAETACGMANIGPDKEGYIHIGVADRMEHANKIKKMDTITPKKINGLYVVGIDREAKLQRKKLEKYVEIFISKFKRTPLSEHLKSSILRNMDTIKYHECSVVRLKIEPQSKVSYVGNQCFIRKHNHTEPINGPELEEIIKRFNKAKSKKQKAKSKKFKKKSSKV